MADGKIEKHPFTPFLPPGTRVVFCGTFPPKPEKWAMDFFYPNFYNDMWRIFGLLYYGDKDRFFNPATKRIDKLGIQEMLTLHKIGMGETAREVVRMRDNASDKFLEIVTPVDLPALLEKIPDCKAIATTGEKAAGVISTLTGTPLPKMGEKADCRVKMADGTERILQHWRLPSTSRAYPMKLEKKASYYADMLCRLGLLDAPDNEP